MLHKDQIIHTLSANAASIATYGVKRIGLFGSYVRTQQTPTSDIDLLIDFDSKKETFENFMGLCDYLENLFPDAKIEVLTTNGLSKVSVRQTPYFSAELKRLILPHETT